MDDIKKLKEEYEKKLKWVRDSAEQSSKSYNAMILELVAERPIAFIPIVARVVRSPSGGLFMSQLLYWWKKGKKPDWIYKTLEEFEEETALTRSEQDGAIKKWKATGVLKVSLKGVPAKRHFQINTVWLARMLLKYKELCDAYNKKETANKFAEFLQTDKPKG